MRALRLPLLGGVPASRWVACWSLLVGSQYVGGAPKVPFKADLHAMAPKTNDNHLQPHCGTLSIRRYDWAYLLTMRIASSGTEV